MNATWSPAFRGASCATWAAPLCPCRRTLRLHRRGPVPHINPPGHVTVRNDLSTGNWLRCRPAGVIVALSSKRSRVRTPASQLVLASLWILLRAWYRIELELLG